MADDGLMINFSVSDEPLKIHSKFKGGNWRERLRLQNNEKRRHLQAKEVQNEEQTNGARHYSRQLPDYAGGDQAQSERPIKRRRTEEQSRDAQRPQSNRHLEHAQSSSKPREVISSLFTYNPSPKTFEEKKPSEPELPVKPTNAPLVDGIDTFTTLGVSPTIAAHLLTKLELKAPTAIQTSAISQLLREDSDAFIQAETGSGKTLAYLLPLVQRIMDFSKPKDTSEQNGPTSIHRDSGLFAIILAPTRELCKQISVVLDSLLRCAHWIVAGTVMGGEKKKSEKARLRKGLNILVATPGRIADHLENTKSFDVSNVRWLVLDEGDRLMDMGFEEEIQGIVNKLDLRIRIQKYGIAGLPRRRTTVLCSATMKMNVQRLGEISLKDAVLIKPDESVSDPIISSNGDDVPVVKATSNTETKFSAPAQLKQSYIVVPAKLRLVTLVAYLKRMLSRKDASSANTKTIVFFSCADSVDFHYDVFTRPAKDNITESAPTTNGTSAVCTISQSLAEATISRLHGSLQQQIRTSTLRDFATSKTPSVLFSTDLASRGLDLPSVDLVIEYDPSFDLPSHIHRIGRTARVGRPGHAILFLLPGSEESYIETLKSCTPSPLDPISYNDTLKKGFGSPGLGAGKDWEEKATDWQLSLERDVLDDPRRLEAARKAFQSHIRAYATHVAPERHMFDLKALHLGHLAKAFGLRDRPANINVPGMRKGGEDVKKSFKERRNGERGGENGDRGEGDEARRKMRAKMKMMQGGGADEFNIA